ncbi:hypothetical protein EWU23_13330 [Cytophagaceae bacterium 50C-KIRBA]|uniref:DUF4142 domain-containing protein n=2 Tax=Aquirufa beregesia TaxID=2516556 RepID=A0ABX0EXX9_9BACT|nr:hypothetical protein [Aquirufa beregesia]
MYQSNPNKFWGTFLILLLFTSCESKYDLREEKLSELIGIRNKYTNSIDSIKSILNEIANADTVAVDTAAVDIAVVDTASIGYGISSEELKKGRKSGVIHDITNEIVDIMINEYDADQRRILLKSSLQSYKLKLKFVKASIDSIKEMDELN